MNDRRLRHAQCDACDLPASVETGVTVLCASCAATMVQFVIDPPLQSRFVVGAMAREQPAPGHGIILPNGIR